MSAYKTLLPLPGCEIGNPVKFDDNAKEYFAETKSGSRIYFQISTVEQNTDWFKKIPDTPKEEQPKYIVNDVKLYTQEQLDKAIEESAINGFNAAREINYVKESFFNNHYEGLKSTFINCSKYKSAESYLSTINKNK